jgi:folate-binding protein YgfZ
MSEPSITFSAPAYDALLHDVVVWKPASAEVLLLEDADRVDFLQRMTTNDIKRLRVGESCVTILTSPTARILHVFTVLADAEALWLLPAPGDAAALERHLRGQIFFMDKVRVRRPDAPLLRFRLIGPRAQAALARIGLVAPPEREGEWRRLNDLAVLKQENYDLPGYEVIAPPERIEAILEQLQAPLLDEATYAARRVELGRPAPGAELTAECNPLEAGMAWACAENKGCYTGQEIIARQITYDKVTRTLVGLRSAALLAPGAAVAAEGREVGRVTSAAFSPQLQAPVALAIVKRPYNAVGTTVVVNGVEATVAALPFIDASDRA